MDKKKVLVTEMLYPEGHKACNEARLRIISEFADIILIDDGVYYSKMNLPETIRHIYVSHRMPSKHVFYKVKRFVPFLKFSPLESLAYLWLLVKVAAKTLFIRYDAVLLLSVRTDALALGRLLFKKTVSVVHHNDLDRLLLKPLDLKFFNVYKNKINHIVIADFIKNGLIKQFNVSAERVFVVHEALVSFKSVKEVRFSEKKNLILGLGQTCDESVLKDLIRLDESCLCDLPFKILMRNKSIEYEGRNLRIINSYLSRDVYNQLLIEAKACVLFYPKEYNLRYSGIIGDSLEYGLSVYGNDIPVVRYYSEMYPKTCHIIDKPSNLFEEIQKTSIEAFVPDIVDYYNTHSYEFIANQFHNMFFGKI